MDTRPKLTVADPIARAGMISAKAQWAGVCQTSIVMRQLPPSAVTSVTWCPVASAARGMSRAPRGSSTSRSTWSPRASVSSVTRALAHDSGQAMPRKSSVRRAVTLCPTIPRVAREQPRSPGAPRSGGTGRARRFGLVHPPAPAPWQHPFAASLGLERAPASSEEVEEPDHAEQPAGVALHDRESRQAAFRHAMDHRAQRLVGIRDGGMTPDHLLERTREVPGPPVADERLQVVAADDADQTAGAVDHRVEELTVLRLLPAHDLGQGADRCVERQGHDPGAHDLAHEEDLQRIDRVFA